MADMTSSQVPVPARLVVHRKSRKLEIAYEKENEEEEVFFLTFELLRVYSPSAEVRGHAPGEEILQTGKRDVDIHAVEPVGNYGIQPRFSDGHMSGIFDWAYLYWLCMNQAELWEDYLRRLEMAGFTRESGRDIKMETAEKSRGCRPT